MIIQRISDELLSSAVFSQLGVLAQPVRSLMSQVTSGIENRSLGYPPLPNLIVSATLGLLVLAILPSGFLLAAEPTQRWQPLLRRVRHGAASEPDEPVPLTAWRDLMLAAAEASRIWLMAILPYAGAAFVLALLGLAPALFGLLCWLLAGVLALQQQIPALQPRLHHALPAIYALATLLMLWISSGGLGAWGG
jgi:hypothetical protein